MLEGVFVGLDVVTTFVPVTALSPGIGPAVGVYGGQRCWSSMHFGDQPIPFR